MNHSSFIYLIDRNGRLRALMPYGHSADDFAHDLRILLKELSVQPHCRYTRWLVTVLLAIAVSAIAWAALSPHARSTRTRSSS